VSEPALLATIVAPATPVGRSALAIVRIDGPRSGDILAALTGAPLPSPRLATRVTLHHQQAPLDDCVAVHYKAPHSFTGNDLVELTLHGNPLLVAEVIRAATALGARMAEPGEFTERAVLNGKLDLVQAESIADLINSRTALQAKLSLHNLEGLLSRTATAIRAELLEVISRLEAALDFADEGYEFIARAEARQTVASAIDRTALLAESYRRGRATTQGVSAVILGRPNAGKSTLLNRLVGSDRAIVTPIPGTTRDIVRETLEIGGLPVTLADTAGLREKADVVEEIGISRAREAARNADLVLYLIDAATGAVDADRAELAALAGQEVLVVYTKSDLASPPAGAFGISVAAEEGVSELLALLDVLVRDRFAAPEGSAAIVNERQRTATQECRLALVDALASVDAALDEQMILVDLHRAANALGALVGAITREDIYTEIFAKFCIGK
jgi:tRNA modification GTPase